MSLPHAQIARVLPRAPHSNDRSLTNQSSFRLASVSKQFTAAGVLLLVERQKLELERPVDERTKIFFRQRGDLLDLMRRPEPVEEVQERDAGVEGGGVRSTISCRT